MIKPTIGRVVLFHPGTDFVGADGMGQPLPALIAHVHSDRCINIGGFDANGRPFGRTSVPLVQDDDDAPDGCDYACWMPYQKGQAANTEELEAAAAKAKS